MSKPAPNRDPVVSVIIHCHNYGCYLPEVIESVQSQTFQDCEIIVVDNGSTDDTASVTRRLATEGDHEIPIRLCSMSDIGPSRGRNAGVSQARGRYIVPLDADDKLAPEYLAKTVPLLEADPRLGFVYPLVMEFGDHSGVATWIREYDFALLCRVNIAPTCALIRKTAFDEAGGYDTENFGYYEDWQLWIRLGAKGWIGRLVSEPLFLYRHHLTSSLSFYAQRLDRFYRAFIISQQASVYSAEEVHSARRTLSEMPPDWHRRPPMRNVPDLEALLEKHPDNQHVEFFLALAYEKQGRKEEAVKLLRRLLRRHPDDAQAVEALAKLTVSTPPTRVLDPAKPNYQNTPASLSRPQLPYQAADPAAPPAVSIITPFFNAGPVFRETAESVLRQSLQQWEWLIVNDGSTEPESICLLDEFRRKDPRIRVVDHPQNKGPAAGRNTGFREARAELVFQLDADDLIEPTALEKMAWHLATHPEAAFASGYSVCFGSAENLWSNGFHDGNLSLEENQMTSSCMVRKSVHQTIGGYDESIRDGLEVWDFWLRAAAHGYWGRTLPEFLDWYRRTENGRERWNTIVDKAKYERFRARLRQRYQGLWDHFPQVETVRQPLATSFGAELPFENRLAKRKRRLLFIVPHFELGGADKFNLTMIQQLQQKHGYEVTVVCTKPSKNIWQHEFENLTPDVFALNNFLHFTEIPRFLRYLIASREPDFVCISNSHLGYQLLPYLLAYFPDLPFVDYLHSEAEKWMSGGYPRISLVYQKQLTRTVVSSEHLKRWMVARGGDPKHIDVCYTDIDVEEWGRDKSGSSLPSGGENRPTHTPVILYAARIEPGKLPMVFAETMRRLAQKQTSFIALVRGDGPDLPKLKEFVQREHLHQVRFLGPVSSEGMRELVASSDILFLPTESEGISLAIYEAMAMSVVPVSADVGGQKELVTPDCGILIQRSSEEADDYAGALSKLISSPGLLRRMAQAARQRVVEHFHIDKFGRKMNEIFESARASFASPARGLVPSHAQANLHATEIIEQVRLAETADLLSRECQRMVLEAKYSATWQGHLRAGQVLIDLGHRQAAVQSLQDGIKAAASTGIFNVELLARVAIAEALGSLDRQLAVDAISGALPLAERLRNPELREALQQKVKRLMTLAKGEAARNRVKESAVRPLATDVPERRKPAPPSLREASVTPALPAQPRLHVTYLISSILGVTGGNQTLLGHVNGLVARGHDVTVVTYTPKPTHTSIVGRVVQVPEGRRMADFVPESDVVVATYFINAVELTNIKAPLKLYYAQGDQYVFADTALQGGQHDQLRKLSDLSYRMADVFFMPNSQNLAKAVHERTGRLADALLPVMVNREIFQPTRRDSRPEAWRILIVGPDSRGSQTEPLTFKGIGDIREAVRLLGQRTSSLQVMRMSSTTPDLFADFPCEFHQAPPSALKTRLYGSADILIYASHYDSCPRPPLEAMSAGCAVVCTDTAGAREYCEDGVNCRMVPIKNPQAIADAVWEIMTTDALRQRIVQGGFATAERLDERQEIDLLEKLLLQFRRDASAGKLPTGFDKQPAQRPTAQAGMSRELLQKKPVAIQLPPCALLGQLGEARQFFNNKKLPAAWGAVRAALKHRPFHPEAYLLLAEIALAAHDAVAARACAQFARQIAPDFKPAKKFLKASLHGNLKPEWIVLPDVVRDPHTTRRPHLSVCLIVKNEERFLGQCLASVEGLADQIVVVDTGSTDRTVEIAKHHKAEVHSFTWCDDFSAARNAALEYVTGDWVLMLDADEELPPEQHEALRKLLRAAPVMAWRLPLQDVGREAEGVSYVPRLFRNAPALFFVGRVHEQVFTSIEVRRQEWGLETRLGDAMLRHYGYTKELTHERDKVGRNLRLLEKAVLETPGEANLLMNYGLELTRSGRPEEGLRQYRAAFEDMADEPTEVVVPETREMLLGQFCTQLMAAKAHAEIIRVLTSPLAKLGVGLTASLHFTLGLAQMELKEFALAAEQFRQCLAKRERPALTPVNVEIRKAGPRHCLALCLAQTNEPVAAESEFQAARQDDAESAPVAADYARFLQEKGRAVEGLQLLHQFTSEHPQAAVAWQVGGAIALSQPEFLEVAVDWTAEALRHFPEDAGIQSQRAEALLLAGQPEAALPLWQKFKASEQPVALAALILCETAVGKNEYAPSPELAGAVTQEFVNCYRRLLVCGAEPVVRRVNAGVDGLARVLPRAAELLRAVIAEANAPGA
jgi:glycosyltransferase involved in cell wall biosynthesis